MRIIADLHIHSKYARACSKELTPENLSMWARKKGIGILGTGDFTHPGWMKDLEQALQETRPGLYTIHTRKNAALNSEKHGTDHDVYFLFTAELSSIYKQGEKVRRVHNLVFAPSMDAAKQFNSALEKRGANLKSDGRPIMGIHCDDLVKIAKDVHENMEIVPAHAWTPHFGVFGSLSGFDNLEEAYGDQVKYIFAIETGLSSSPQMNWQVEGLDNISLISNSDPHSLHRLGREANVFEVNEEKLSYTEIIRIIKGKNPTEFLSTLEFFPEEGRYHLDGHATCKFSCLPEETKRLGGVCPVCGKQILRGVLNRVQALGVRQLGNQPGGRIPFKNIISLEEVIADTLDVGVASKKVQNLYESMVAQRPEFEILLDLSESEIEQLSLPSVAKGVSLMRAGKVHIIPGYDGEYGKIHIFTDQERPQSMKQSKQSSLF